MTAVKLNGAPFCGITGKQCERRELKKWSKAFLLKDATKASHNQLFDGFIARGFRSTSVAKCCGSIGDQQTAECSLKLSVLEESFTSNCGRSQSKRTFDSMITSQSRPQSVQTEFIMLSLPAIAGQAIEPLAQLMETAYVGRLGPLELASAGVSMSIFNILSKVFNIPLLSVATSFVAEDIARSAGKSTSGVGSHMDEMCERKSLPSISTALVLALGIGVFEALSMYFGSGFFLQVMGISPASPMRIPAERFLKLRALGAPAVVVTLAIQGIFRGFKDTKTPVFCLGFGNFSAVFLFPLLMYASKLGVTGAAISTVISQYVVTFMMIWHLNKRTVLSLPNIRNMHFGCYLRSGGFLLGRTLAAVMTITLSTSMAARQGALAMAAHQICLQVWLSVSLLADAQGASGQALIASSSAKGDYRTVKQITFFALKTGLITGLSLALLLGVSFGSLATLFTKDAEVLAIVRSGILVYVLFFIFFWHYKLFNPIQSCINIPLFVSASQPINALAYIFDGLHYGISDFSYAAWSMMAVGAVSSAFMLYAPSFFGLSGVWSGLTLFMGLRTVAGYTRLMSKNGPWWFLQEDVSENLRLVDVNPDFLQSSTT